MDYSYNLIVVHTLLYGDRKMLYIGAGQSIFICPVDNESVPHYSTWDLQEL